MRVFGVAFVLVMVGLATAASRPEAASACVGRTLDLEDALRLSNGAIYAGRITRAEVAATFWVDLTIDIDLVVRGPAATRVPRAQAGYVCDGIQVGQYGFIVRGVRDPDFPSADLDDVFVRISRSDAQAALIAAGLPDTAISPGDEAPTPPTVPWAWLALWSVSAFVLTAWTPRRRWHRDSVHRT